MTGEDCKAGEPAAVRRPAQRHARPRPGELARRARCRLVSSGQKWCNWFRYPTVAHHEKPYTTVYREMVLATRGTFSASHPCPRRAHAIKRAPPTLCARPGCSHPTTELGRYCSELRSLAIFTSWYAYSPGCDGVTSAGLRALLGLGSADIPGWRTGPATHAADAGSPGGWPSGVRRTTISYSRCVATSRPALTSCGTCSSARGCAFRAPARS